MFTPSSNFRRLGQEDRTARPESHSRPSDSIRLPFSSPRQPSHGSSRTSGDKDVIVLSDSEEEVSNRTNGRKAPIDLTLDDEDSINPWRLLNRRSQRPASLAVPSTPGFRQPQAPLDRGSAQTSLHSATSSSHAATSRSIPQSPLSHDMSAAQSIASPPAWRYKLVSRDSDNSANRQQAQVPSRSSAGFETSIGAGRVPWYGHSAFLTSAASSKRVYLPATTHQQTGERQRAEIGLDRSPPEQSMGKQNIQTNGNQVTHDKAGQTLREEITRRLVNRIEIPSQTVASDLARQHVQAVASRSPDNVFTKTRSTSAIVTVGQTASSTARRAAHTPAGQLNAVDCTNCSEQKLTCDKLSPCAHCRKAGILCSYSDTRPPLERRLSKIVKLALPRSATVAHRSTDASNPFVVRQSLLDDQSDASRRSNARLRVEDLGMSVLAQSLPEFGSLPHLVDGHVDEEESIESDLSSTSEQATPVEPELKTVTIIMEQLRQDLFAWREKTVQADLRQAAIDMKQDPGPKLDSTLEDPFKALTDQRRSNSGLLPPLGGAPTEGASFVKPQSRKALVLRATETSFWTGATLLPKYKAIGRVSSSFLAPNYRTAKYRPYDAEDEVQDPEATEKYAELEQRFNNNHDSLLAQRDCQELVWLWQPWAQELYSSLGIHAGDVLYFFTHALWDPREIRCEWSAEASRAWSEEQSRGCCTCELADNQSKWTFWQIHKETFNSLPKPDDHKLALAGLAAYAFHEMTGVSLWHVTMGGILKPLYEDPTSVDTKGLGFCVICFRHQCPDHGSYEEPTDEGDGGRDPEDFKAFVNDEEGDHNLRKFMCLPTRERKQGDTHVCGLFCVDTTQSLQQILGRQEDGSISGDFRTTAGSRHVLADDELCSDLCFWDAINRRDSKVSDMQFQPFASPSEKILVDKVLQFYLNNKRGPCLISRIVKDVSCMKIFEHLVWHICHVPHPVMDAEPMSDSSTAQRQSNHVQKKKKPKVIPNIDVSRSAELDQRPPFIPCSHTGPCYNNPACSCFKSRVHCERFCGCDEACKRRFRGCTCTTRGNKICFKDSRCECWKHNRECDPYLCGRCGVHEVLDSSNKYRDDIRKGLCRNNRIQLGLPAPTTKAPSQVQGYGLYSRADIASGDFIGEYTGEVISISEGDRRGAMYHVLNQEYLFVINRGQEIDASNNGNKMRFMNNSQRDEHINVEPKKLWCSGVVRVGLFAKRFIKAGEELLYNYNYPESVVKNFWEPGEKPASVRRLIPTGTERAARSTGANKLADEKGDHSREESSQSPLLTRHPKRKRAVEESPEIPRNSRSAAANRPETESSADELSKAPEIDDTEDSDYETNGIVTDEGGEVEEGEDEESDLDPFEEPAPNIRGAGSRRPLPGAGNSKGKVNKSNARSRSQDDKPSRLKHGGKSNRVANKNLDGAGSTSRRKRKIGPHDKRFGGRAQQLAWQTRRQNETMGNAGSSPRNR
ncbi:hypothetical protein EDD37DRAFT_612156 [Exophiala viscosa]|uniref:SET domain-containing protein n=1 Tax=Exophiala viscosa TaxID=2486360 RepID=A0AAN6DX76_9EURO|nr:hypothetical protein EDD36DRAFT_220721 [Exophiala viscosa]KAI1621655.1 hypothetical protein EDD37DRAFT_612156 [Exophiala viscosa]